MKWNWRRAAREAITRNDHRSILAGAVAGVGGAIAIGVMEWFSVAAHYPLAAIPFATSIVLVIGSPEAEPAQPRAGRRPLRQRPGRLCGAQIDRPASLGGGRRPIHSRDVRHWNLSSAGGINPLLVVSGNLPWTFLFAPVLAGGVLLTAFAWLWHRWVRGQKWPQRWLRPAQGFDASHRSHPAGRRAADGGRKHSQFHVECHVDLRVPRLNSCRSNGHEPSNKVELTLGPDPVMTPSRSDARRVLHRESIAVADHGDMALMEGFERRAVADRDDGGFR